MLVSAAPWVVGFLLIATLRLTLLVAVAVLALVVVTILVTLLLALWLSVLLVLSRCVVVVCVLVFHGSLSGKGGFNVQMCSRDHFAVHCFHSGVQNDGGYFGNRCAKAVRVVGQLFSGTSLTNNVTCGMTVHW